MKFLILFFFIFLSVIGFSQEKKDIVMAIAEMERIHKETYDTEAGIASSEAVLKLVSPKSLEYFDALFYLGDWYITKRDKVGITTLLDKIELDLASIDKNEGQALWIYLCYLKGRYNYEIMYNYEKAAILVLKAFYEAKTHPKILNKITPITAKLMSDLRLLDAAKSMIKIYKITDGWGQKSKFEQCKIHIEVADIYRKAELYEDAKLEIRQAIDIIEPLKSTTPKLYYEAMFMSAKIHRGAGENDKCIAIIKQLITVCEYQDYRFLGLLATALSSQDIYEEALTVIQETLILMTPNFSSTNIADNPNLGVAYVDEHLAGIIYYYKSWALRLKALQYIKEGNRKKGEALLRKSIETGAIGVALYNEFIDEITGFEFAILIVNAELHIIMGGMIHSAKSLCDITQNQADLEQLFRIMESRRSLSILQKKIKSPIPEGLLPAFEGYTHKIELLELKAMLDADILGVEDFSLFEDVFDSILEYEVFFENLKQQTPAVRLSPDDISYITIKELQASLNDETVFIQYSIVRDHLYALLITKDTTQLEMLRESDYMLEEDIFDYINKIRNPLLIQEKNRDDFINQSHTLYRLLIQPFENNMKSKTRFVISPERELLFLPYETLLKTADKKAFNELDFLIKTFEINYRYSATLHRQIQAGPAPKDYSFLGFAPVFANGEGTAKRDRSIKSFRDSRYKSINKKRFIHLPNTKKEVETIKRLLLPKGGEITIFLDEDATKTNLINSFTNSYQFIHIATHSMVNYRDPRLSAIACYHSEGKENLYFSNDIINKKIQVDLVVLSSCESGVGRIIEGEGILGLNRSFISSGAKNVIFSLWKVDDEHSSEMMISFYEFYFINFNYTSALRQAKLKMLNDEKAANPRYWATFVLIGE